MEAHILDRKLLEFIVRRTIDLCVDDELTDEQIISEIAKEIGVEEEGE